MYSHSLRSFSVSALLFLTTAIQAQASGPLAGTVQYLNGYLMGRAYDTGAPTRVLQVEFYVLAPKGGGGIRLDDPDEIRARWSDLFEVVVYHDAPDDWQDHVVLPRR